MFIIWIYGSVVRKISGKRSSFINVTLLSQGMKFVFLFCSIFTLTDMVVILKNDLKKLPIIGWCMQMTLYVFLQVK
jgi:hypothetical protein